MKQDQTEQFQVSQKLVLFDPEKKKFLLVKDAEIESYFHKHHGPWELIGGRIQLGEDFLEAFKREVREEAGDLLQYDLMGCIHGLKMSTRVGSMVCLAYLGMYKGGEINLSDEHNDLRWATAEEVGQSQEYKPWLKTIIAEADKRLKELSYLNDLKRLQADFENYKKRMAKSQAEMTQFMVQGLVTDLVPILDNFHAAITHVPEAEQGSAWVTGITYIEKQFEDVLKNYGVEPLEVQPGDVFDPAKHEALSNEEHRKNPKQGTEGAQPHTISRVIQKGYAIKERIIRPAKVIVH